MVIFGMYKFAPTLVAYRADYCLTCKEFTVSEHIRSFYVGYLYWIPLLPLGFWKQWFCAECSYQPHVRTETGRGMLILGGLLALLFAAVYWDTIPGTFGNPILNWFMRIAMPVAAVIAFKTAARRGNTPELEEKLRRLPEFKDGNCLYCTEQLVRDPKTRCLNCDIERIEHDHTKHF